MNIYKYTGLAIFASLCFLSGIVFGEMTTSTAAIKTVLEDNRKRNDMLLKEIRFIEISGTLRTLNEIKKRDDAYVDDLIETYTGFLQTLIEKTEESFSKLGDHEKAHFQASLIMAKDLLDDLHKETKTPIKEETKTPIKEETKTPIN